MGQILNRFRRKKSSEEILEEIQSDIESLEGTRECTLQKQKYIVGRLIIYSVLLYIVAALLFYFCFFPASLTDRIFYMIPLLIFPIIVVLLKKIVTWYYRREIIISKEKLTDLKNKKKKILEDVMNKETYKIAKDILEKFAPEQLKKSESESPPRLVPLQTPGRPIGGLNGRPPPPSSDPKLLALPPPPPGFQQQGGAMGPPQLSLPLHSRTPSRPIPLSMRRPSSPQRRLIRPIFPQNRSFVDRLIESLMGDGPNNRYALVCRNCAMHNGMALKDEFEYLAFRCVYCGFPNPSHKVRSNDNNLISSQSSEERKADGGGESETDVGSKKGDDEEEIRSGGVGEERSGGEGEEVSTEAVKDTTEISKNGGTGDSNFRKVEGGENDKIADTGDAKIDGETAVDEGMEQTEGLRARRPQPTDE